MTTLLSAVAQSAPPGVRLAFGTDAAGAVAVILSRVQVGNTRVVYEVPIPGPSASAVYTQVDHSVLIDGPASYMATAVNAAGVALERSPSTSAVIVAGDSAWLIDPSQPVFSMPVRLVGREAGDSGTSERAALLEPLGRRNPVAVTDVRSGASGTTTILTATGGDERRLRGILASGRPLLFTAPVGFDILYPLRFTAGSVSVARISDAQDSHRLFVIGWTEVDPPSTVVPSGNTWGWYVGQGRLWSDWITAGKTWSDVVGGTARLVAP